MTGKRAAPKAGDRRVTLPAWKRAWIAERERLASSPASMATVRATARRK